MTRDPKADAQTLLNSILDERSAAIELLQFLHRRGGLGIDVHRHIQDFLDGVGPHTPAALLEFGAGALVVDTGRHDQQPAVFIARAKRPGEIGTSAARENHPLDRLQPGEVVLTFPTEEQAKRVADAMVYQNPDPNVPPQAPEKVT